MSITAASPVLEVLDGADPDLSRDVARWRREVPRARRRLDREASTLARPRLWTDTLGALGVTGWRAVRAAAPVVPSILLRLAASRTGVPIGPPPDEAVLERAQELVREGGATYVKLGQFVASSRGLLPDEWVEAFSWCRDSAGPLPIEVVRGIVTQELGEGVRLTIDAEPLAAGSIGQVHAATLSDGREVVVKVQRPGLDEQVRSDLAALALLAAGADRLHPALRAANLPGFIELFAELLLQELDFRFEALNMVESRASFADRGLDLVRVPQPVAGMTTARVLVMDRLEGIPYDRVAEERGAFDGSDLVRFAIRAVVETTLLDGLFHGDLHAGNVLVSSDARFSLLDFGICGRMDFQQRGGLLRFLLGFAAGDADAQIAAMVHFGAIPAGSDLGPLRLAYQEELDRIDVRADGSVTFERLAATVGRMLRILAAHGFRMPKDLVLFFKNLLYLGDLAGAVAPEMDLFAEITQILSALGRERETELRRLLA
jgi:ubiquinone biosynthesis protein